ncbi:MAG: aldose 1-epimerase family protein [Clostridia bacterium]|nr:aldose 1-epimerase family protein [Clostridia bacterium]
MFTKPYPENETVSLRYGETTAVIRLAGAQLCSFKGPDGREVMWQADPSVWDQHAPVLFPVCGAPKNGEVIIGEKHFEMPKHGFTRSNPLFTVIKKGEDFVDLEFRSNDETLAHYPFEFSFHVIYSLFERGIRTTFLVENLSKDTMPFCVGGHPAFNCPMEPDAFFEDYDVVFEKEESGEVARVPGGGLIDGKEKLPFFRAGRILPLDHREIDTRDSLLFMELNSRAARLVNRNTGKGLTVSFPKMEAMAVWSMGGKQADYICLEPWHGIPASVEESGKFEDKPYVTMLPGGETYVTWYDVVLD